MTADPDTTRGAATPSQPGSASPPIRRRSRLPGATMTTAVGVAVLAGILTLALRLWLKWVGPFPGDVWALHHLDSGALPGPVGELGIFFSVIGTPAVAGVSVAVALPFVWRSDGWRGAAFVLAAGLGVFFNMAMKVLSGPTPLMIERDPSMTALNYPSGHTVYGVVFFGSLAWLAWRHRRVDVALPFVGLLVLMGPSRVIVEAHFVSDVIAGYLVGAAWLVPAAIATGLASRRAPRRAGRGTAS